MMDMRCILYKQWYQETSIKAKGIAIKYTTFYYKRYCVDNY